MKEVAFFDENRVLGESEQFLLRKVKEEEFPLFAAVLSEGKGNKEDYQTQQSLDFLKEELSREDALYCAVIRKEDGAFCGYVGIAELTEKPWEFAIELFKKYHRQGIGFKSLSLFLDSVKERTGVSEFKSCVDGLNLASQKLMEKSKGTLVNVVMEDGKPVMVYHHKLG